ncbi:HXXEE domain-containing protein [Thiomonas intermedia]|uniref:HXXEE domain-containing protein n=1 Tax=Thiomonas intermedia TaxID=926 RepID=UPI0009A4755F|nr:HXXEE domain-containing protein [Thiomonas intermedia]
MLQRLITYWVYGGFLAGLLLLLLSPLLLADWSVPLAAAFLLLPAYMLHQYEEHDDDRFRLFLNQTIGKGYDVLSPLAVFIINVPGVWGVMALSLYAAVTVNPGWALIAVDLALVNAFVHIVHALIFRRYNPGLATALVIFLPLGGTTLWLIGKTGQATALEQGVSLLLAIAIHAAILIHVHRRLVALQRAQGNRRG